MQSKTSPFRRTVFVCTNKRDGGRVACANEGRDGEAICEALKHAVKEKGLKQQIRVARSGCMDLCEQGPNVLICPGGEWLSRVSLSDVPEILRKIEG